MRGKEYIEEPLVTVVIPSYNHDKYIKDAVISVVNQKDYSNIEFIVIDDGSTDSSPIILDKLSKKYNFRYYHRENRGLCKTLNEALSLSSGKYFSICASDDIFISDKIVQQVKFLEKNPNYAVCYGNIIGINDFGDIESRVEVENAKSGWIFKELILGEIGIPAPSTMIRTEILRELGGYSEDISIEDWDIWLRVSEKYEIGYLNRYLACYRNHNNNTYKQSYNMFKAQKEILEKWNSYRDYNYVLEVWKLRWFKSLSRRGYIDEAKNYMGVALKNIFDIDVIKILIKYHILNFSKN